jgi:dTDP-4-amino-4,6-dideoxygalactose transaminase
MKAQSIGCVFHYVPLHSSGLARGGSSVSAVELDQTSMLSERLVRLPLWIGLSEQQDNIIQSASQALSA